MRVGLLGGTFDPIHVGHLWTAEVARHALSLDRVEFVPAGDPPHKGETVTDAEHRFAMALLAVEANDAFFVSRRELERTGPSYSLTTVLEYRRELGQQAELFFIVGADAILEICTWHRWEELLRACHFAAITRPGVDTTALRSLLPEELLKRVHWLKTPGLDVSSTEVRARVRRNEPVRYLVPDAVDAYIQKHRLYQS